VQCDGESLLPLLQRESETPQHWRPAVHWEFDFRDVQSRQYEQALGIGSDQCTLNVIRDRRYKYVHFSALPPLFFDLQEDPFEFHNCAAEPAYRERVLHYAQQLLSLRMTHAERILSNTLLTAGGVIEQQRSRWSC
jgi:arylsulfatase A-like enzyme